MNSICEACGSDLYYYRDNKTGMDIRTCGRRGCLMYSNNYDWFKGFLDLQLRQNLEYLERQGFFGLDYSGQRRFMEERGRGW